ncbi:MAG: hypothetical protein LBJ86_05290 [Spirochaetaceae bacterium]|jgi:phosphate/sulfate permease|nr:hypothetical protein [Spirochaetaceae bacterium]
MVKRIIALAAFALITAGAYAQVTISSGFALSSTKSVEVSSAGMSYPIDVDALSGFAWGVDIGVSYYFSPVAGIFAEGGFDDYMLESNAKFADGSTLNIKAPFQRFLTAGISVKF